MSVTETELIDQILGGDKEAFDELARRYWKTAYVLCQQRLGDAEEAKDIAQRLSSGTKIEVELVSD